MSILNAIKKIIPEVPEKGYRPIGKIDITKPPRGGSGIVPPKRNASSQQQNQK